MEPESKKTELTSSDDWNILGRKLLITISLIIISGATLVALKAIFHPPDSIDFDFGWTCGFQFLMLYSIGDAILKQTTRRLVLYVFIMAIWTTSVFFAFDMWL